MKIMRVVSIVVLLGLVTTSLFATNGYFRHGFGTKHSALAGSGVALSLSSLAPATNPAGLAFLGREYEINIGLFSPDREYTVTGNPSGFPQTFGLTPGTITSDSKLFVIPTLGANWSLGESGSIGLMMFANGGMNTDYPTQTFYEPTSPSTGVNLEQAFIGVTYALEFVKDHALGVTPIYGMQRFAAKGVASFGGFSRYPDDLSGNSHSVSSGFGARFGYQGKLLPVLSVGAAYQTKIAMGEFDEYRGLFAEQGGFDVPANWTAGLAAKATDQVTIAFDVQQILYSGVKSIANPLKPADFQAGILLGDDNGAGFGWKDIMVFKLGLMWQASKEWTWMAGYSYSEQPIPESEVLFNILAPGVVQHHITAGVTRVLENTHELSLAVMFAPASTVTGPNPLDAPNQQSIQISMSQWQVEVGYTIR